jgi:hypothetical protein
MCVSAGYVLVEIHVAKAVGGTVVHAPVLIILRPWTFLRVVAMVSLLINILYSSAIPYVHFCALCFVLLFAYLEILSSVQPYMWCFTLPFFFLCPGASLLRARRLCEGESSK